jgi:hypothetical protein
MRSAIARQATWISRAKLRVRRPLYPRTPPGQHPHDLAWLGRLRPSPIRRCPQARLPPRRLRRPASADVARGPRLHRSLPRHRGAHARACVLHAVAGVAACHQDPARQGLLRQPPLLTLPPTKLKVRRRLRDSHRGERGSSSRSGYCHDEHLFKQRRVEAGSGANVGAGGAAGGGGLGGAPVTNPDGNQTTKGTDGSPWPPRISVRSRGKRSRRPRRRRDLPGPEPGRAASLPAHAQRL